MRSGGSDSLSDAVMLLSLRRPATTASPSDFDSISRHTSAVSSLATPRHPHKDDSSLRPKAPIHPQQHKAKRGDDKRNISELWKSLDDYNRKTTKGGEEEGGDHDDYSYEHESNSSDVHFLNIDNSKSSRFVIPELPNGQVVKINILSTWGDPHLLGLMGIEIFDDRGVAVTHARTKSYADPQGGEHAVENLFDGVNHTCDERHSWLAPFTQGRDHLLFIELDRPCTIAMIRVWNYNKSRPHSYRGARYIEIFLDGYIIFKGEIRRALGSVNSHDCCESILFTRSRGVLDLIEARDPLSRRQEQVEEEEEQRPCGQRVFTRGSFSFPSPGDRPASTTASSSSGVRPSTAALAKHRQPVYCRLVELVLRSNWGDRSSVGITRLTAVDEKLADLELPPLQLFRGSLDARGTVLLGEELPLPQRGREGSILVNYPQHYQGGGKQEGSVVVLRFDFGRRVALKGLKVWNYSDEGEGEGAFMGAKHVTVYVDGALALNTIVRKAPGERRFDYHQFLPLNSSADSPAFAGRQGETGAGEGINNYNNNNNTEEEEEGEGEGEGILFFNGTADTVREGPRCCEELQQYETPVYPTGSLVKMTVLRNHGDAGFVSIDGLLLYDRSGWPIHVDEEMVKASPYKYIPSPYKSAARARGFEAVCLEGWVAPLAEQSTLYILFDEPVTIGLIKIYNCSRRPERGARDIELYIDDEVIFKGSINASPAAQGAGKTHPFYDFSPTPTSTSASVHQSILFTNDSDICERERRHIPVVEEEMLFIDGGSARPQIE